MHITPLMSSRLPASLGSAITHVTVSSADDATPPSLTSGFGAVVEQDRDLQSKMR
jgi:hypothetical protein